MELIYLYIENYNDVFKKQEINFSSNFNVKIINKKLIIEKKTSYINKLYPSNIKNITMLLGKNGSGKTTVIDILGVNSEDRCNNSIKRNPRCRSEVVDSYFILYHLQGDYFGIEVVDDIEPGEKITRLFKYNLTNFNFDKVDNPFYKIPIGLVIKKNEDNFEVVQHFFNRYPSLNYKVNEKIKVNYIANKYSDRVNTRYNYIGKDEDYYEDNAYLCKRRYYLTASKMMKYRYIKELSAHKDLNYCADLATIKIRKGFDYKSVYSMDNKDLEERWIYELEKKLYVDNSDRINLLNLSKLNERIEISKDKTMYKKSFILDMLSRYIIHQFIEGVCNIIDDNKINNEDSEAIAIDFSNNDHIEFLNNLKKREFMQINSSFIFGKIFDKYTEYQNLVRIIDYYKKDMMLKSYDKLICISRYLYSRIESYVELGSRSEYQTSIEEFFSAIKNLKESYFHKNCIVISCNSEVDKEVEEVIKVYDKYLKSSFSDLNMKFKLEISNLSEGENNFLDLLSKIFDIVEESKEDELLIVLLDEPDQSLHPEWSRRFIKFLCDDIAKYNNRSIQIILSTHSPFMVTDIMSDNVYCLENNKNIEESRINIYPMTRNKGDIYNTFAANIYEILKDSFFLEKTIGELAYYSIKELIEKLNDSEDYSDIRYEEYLTNSIGEYPLRNKLKYMYSKKVGNNKKLKSDLIDKIKLEANQDKLNKIKQILNGEINDQN